MFRSLLLVFISLLLLVQGPARAQTTAPAWQQARALSSPAAGSLTGLVLDAQGNRYVTGTFEQNITLAPGTTLTSRGNVDAYLAKYSAGGALLWAEQIGGPGPTRAASLALDPSGNIHVLGQFETSMQLGTATLTASPSTPPPFFLAALSPQGQVLSLRAEGLSTTSGSSTSGYSFPYSIGVDAGGNVYVLGTVEGDPVTLGGMTTIAVPGNSRDYFLVKFGAGQSTALWVRQGGRAQLASTYPPTLIVAPWGDCYLVGTFAPNSGPFGQLQPTEHGDYDIGVVLYTGMGTELMAQRSGGPGFDWARYATLHPFQGLAVAGEFRGAATFAGQPLVGTGTRSGALLVYGTSNLAERWARVLTGTNIAYYGGVTADVAGNFYAVGAFDGSGTAQGGPALTSTGGTDAVVVAYSSQGSFRWQQPAGGPNNDNAFFVQLDPAQHLVVGGGFVGSARFGPSLSISGGPAVSNPFLAELGAVSLAARPAQAVAPLALYPNPARGAAQLPPLPAGTQIGLTDALGRETAGLVRGGQLALDGLAPGLYQVQATAPDGRRWSCRLLVE